MTAEEMDVSKIEFLVFGSVANPHHHPDVGDIDLVVPEFTDDRMYDTSVTLEAYEKLAEVTGKPIDLFFSKVPSDFNLAGWYKPGSHWRFREAFCGKFFFDWLTPMTFSQIADAVAMKAKAVD